MKNTPFYRLGFFSYRFRSLIIILWTVLILCCIPFLPNIIAPFQSTGFIAENSPSAKIDRILDRKLGFSSNQLLIIYHSKDLTATNALFQEKLERSLHQLKNYPLKTKIIFPNMNKKQISSDKHTAYVVLFFESKSKLTAEQLQEIKSLIKKPSHMTMELGGESVFIDSLNVQTQKDLSKADLIAAPISIITLILVFGSIIAATLPVILGGSCAVLILMTLYLIAHAFTLSIFTLNIALLLGLCLSLDYSLFIISRFREELAQKRSLPDSIAITIATAGKSVFFSGLAVFISLSALLMFPVNILFSVGVGGLVAVFVAVTIAILVLPAVLSILNTNINRLPVRLFHTQNPNKSLTWRWIALNVVKRPLLFFATALLFLLLLGAPFLNANIGVSNVHILPKHSDSRVFFDQYEEKFNANDLTPIRLAVTTQDKSILSAQNIANIYDLSKKIKENPLVESVSSITTLDHSLSKHQYQMLYNSSKRYTDPAITVLLKTTTDKNLTTINVVSKYGENSPKTAALISQLRDINPGKGLEMQMTGVFANNQDVMKSIAKIFPYAVIWILILTYLILLLLLRSVFLPLKAIVMNILSLCASYGVLVFIFQEGHLHQLLDFDPQHLVDISLMVIIFCALFGFSMDYEVFLLTRIQESYLKNKDNNHSIVFGIEHSSRIITSAALIVIVTCASFMVAEVLMVKEFGLGIAVAIAVDAFIVRSLLVPATMALVKQWNWYMPTWLDKILPKV
jgi:putative drug exporter of the RND superfamily